MLLYYIRHGDPIYDPDSLTSLGERQAEALAKRLAVYGIDTIYASTSNRAILTAKPTSEILKKEIHKMDFLNEGCAWEKFTIADGKGVCWLYHSRKIVNLFVSSETRELKEQWYRHEEITAQNYEESVKWINKNTDDFLLSLGFKHDREKGVYEVIRKNSERIAVFAHEGIGKAFLSSMLDIPYPMFSSHFELNHSGMTVIHFGENGDTTIPRMLMMSNDSHLYKEGLPTNYHNWLQV